MTIHNVHSFQRTIQAVLVLAALLAACGAARA